MRVNLNFNLIFLLLIVLAVNTSFGQVYSINNGFTNGDYITTCGGSFFDSNPNGNYTPNEDYTVTFCSGSPGKVIQIIFSNLHISSGDTLFTYDGNSINNPVLDTFTGIASAFEYTTPSATNYSGCITFRFVSNSTVENEGWAGQIRCIYPCTQRILATPHTTPLADSFGYTNICFGDPVTLGVKTLYPDNDNNYHQNDSSSLFHWFFGDGTDSIGVNLVSINHTYKGNGGYYSKVIITDSNGCTSPIPISMPVRTSVKPFFNITSPSSLCLLDTIMLRPVSTFGAPGSVSEAIGSFVNLPISGDSVFLPDNPPICFNSTIIVDQFLPGQTLTNINDLKGIFMKLEHSYLGDITIGITAPNGVTVMLKSTVGATINDGTFLGEPVDETLNGGLYDSLLSNVIGKGYDYSFDGTPQYSTMWSEASRYTQTFTDNVGRVVTHFYLPAGSYASEQNLSALIGTPLNGSWVLQICDKQSNDNGFLFSWKIEFSSAITPSSVTYTIPITSQEWLPAIGIINTNNAIATVSPPSTGTYLYKFKLTDGFGCEYDTTIKTYINRLPIKPVLGPDKKICINQPTILKVYNPQAANKYAWNVLSGDTTSITISQPGSYWVKVTDTNGCTNTDTLEVSLNLPFRISLGNDTMYCASQPNVLAPQSISGIVEWSWNTGDSTANLTINSPGTYWLQGKNTGGCWVRDSIVITDNPINTFRLPKDTSICDNTGFLLKLQPPNSSTNVVWQNGQVGNQLYVESGKTYKIAADYKSCISNSSMKVDTKPLPVFHLGNDTTLCVGYELNLHGSWPNASYLWSTGSRDSLITATAKGLYWAQATYNGCVYKDSIVFDQKNCSCDIEMPNAFSPNGDGINDVYHPYIKCFPRNYQLSFFNRFGQQVFSSKDYHALWDGRWNGNLLQPGTYYYILTFYNEELQRVERRGGSVTLLR